MTGRMMWSPCHSTVPSELLSTTVRRSKMYLSPPDRYNEVVTIRGGGVRLLYDAVYGGLDLLTLCRPRVGFSPHTGLPVHMSMNRITDELAGLRLRATIANVYPMNDVGGQRGWLERVERDLGGIGLVGGPPTDVPAVMVCVVNAEPRPVPVLRPEFAGRCSCRYVPGKLVDELAEVPYVDPNQAYDRHRLDFEICATENQSTADQADDDGVYPYIIAPDITYRPNDHGERGLAATDTDADASPYTRAPSV